MTATVFPAYALARLVVSRWYALAAAGGATAVPALAYSTIIVEEPLAYPMSTLTLWLIARALAEPELDAGRGGGLAVVAAALTRTQLAILLVVLVLGLLWLGWESERVRRWRSEWSRWDWAGAVMLVVGVALGFGAFFGHYSTSWRNTTGFYKERIFDHGVWAMGALAIGIGIVPMLVGIAALARPKDEPRDPKTRAFVVTSVAALAVFLGYAGIKGAYISTVFATLVVERNVIYLGPVLFAATALAIERGVGRGWAIAGAAAFTLFVVASTPLHLENYPYYEAHGLSIAAFANRELSWPEGGSRTACSSCAAWRSRSSSRSASSAAARAPTACSPGRPRSSSSRGRSPPRSTRPRASATSRRGSRGTCPAPYDWVEEETGGKSVVVVGQQVADPTNVWLTEFFNPSIRKMWSLDGTAPGPGPILTPDLVAADGTLTPPPGTDYALGINGVELQAPIVERRGTTTLYRLDGGPLKLASAVTGLYSDGWIGDRDGNGVAEAAYTRYDVSRDGPGSRSSSSPASPGAEATCRARRPSASAPSRSARTGSRRSPTSPRRR